MGGLLGGRGGGKRVCWPPSQIIGGAGQPPLPPSPPLPTSMNCKKNGKILQLIISGTYSQHLAALKKSKML